VRERLHAAIDEPFIFTSGVPHHSRLDDVDWASHQAGDETGAQGGADVRENVILHTDSQESLLKLIVRHQLGGVDD